MDSLFNIIFGILNIYAPDPEASKDHLSDLPVEIILIISGFLNNRDMCSLSAVSPYYSRATQLSRDSRKQVQLSKNWIRSIFPVMIVCDDYTFERYEFPQFVINYIRERWVNIQNDGTGRKVPTYRHPDYIICDGCRRDYRSVSLAIVDSKTLCWGCAH